MTRLFTDGAEMQDTLFWDTVSNVTVESSTPYISPYYYAVATNALRNLVTSASMCYFRARVRHSSTTTTAYYVSFRNLTNTMGRISLDATQHWTAIVGSSTTVGTSTATFNTDQWYLLEVYYTVADSGGRFVVKIDGNTEIDYTGDTKYSTQTTFDNIYFARGGAGTLLLDDLALNDGIGTTDNSWIGAGIVLKITPDSDGATNQWLLSSGSTAYGLTDDFPNDGDTTYIYASGSSTGNKQNLGMTSFDGSGKTILRVWGVGRARKTLADGSIIKIGTLASGGTPVTGSAVLTTSYARVVGPEATVNPVDSQPWEEADINALEFVSEVG